MSKAEKLASTPKKVPEQGLISRAIAGLLWRMPKLGIRINPYVAVQEGAIPASLPALPASMKAEWVTVEDIDALDALWAGHHGTDRARLLQRFSAGNRCFAVRDGLAIPAATWCDFDNIVHASERRTLAPHEVYLFDAFVSPAARGRNLAPIMRAACYDACRALGRTTMLSFTDYFNESSHRFKAKLGARKLRLAVQVTLFGRWAVTVPVRSYPQRM